MRVRHPGTIVYVNGNSGDVVQERNVEDVPEHLRFAKTDKGDVPVVRVVATKTGDTRSIVEFGPSDEVLRTTGQRR